MAHNEDVLRITTFDNTTVVTPEMLRRLDILAAQSVNGDEGGDWAPESPIVVGGDGLYFDNVGSIEGGIKTGKLARPGAIELAEGHWPSFSSRTHRVVFSLNDGLFNNRENWTAQDGTAPSYGGIRFETSASMLCPLPSFRFLRGSKIRDITLRWKTGKQVTSVPGTMPSMALFLKRDTRNIGALIRHIDPWLPTHMYATGDWVISNSLVENFTLTRAFVCIGSLGTPISGTTEPAGFATTAPGLAVVDGPGSIIWFCVSLNDLSDINLGNLVALGSTQFPNPGSPSAYYNGGQPKEVKIYNANVFNTIYSGEYFLYIKDLTNTLNTYLSLVIDFDTFIDLRPGY